jgi:hypothetical protein
MRDSLSTFISRAQQCSERSAGSNRRFKFKKRSQLFIGMHNVTFPIVAVRVCDPDLFACWNQSLRRSPNSNRAS